MTAANDDNAGYRPCLVLAHTEPGYAAQAARAFRRLGWDVYEAGSGPEARRLARMLGADLVVLDADLPGESGWLTCEKVRRELPRAGVVLVTPNPDERGRQFAAFVGARALVSHGDGLPALLREVCASGLPAAG